MITNFDSYTTINIWVSGMIFNVNAISFSLILKDKMDEHKTLKLSMSTNLLIVAAFILSLQLLFGEFAFLWVIFSLKMLKNIRLAMLNNTCILLIYS